ncbi:zinc finger protein CONSTANS-LIKE 2 isoform X1 [Iris pallida]|uniref:Zinc finger protein CONSTANS-LIKE 2 isoform X1 n=1 Tax=Iris pallida TaxID=29817 RepID=A0AAX6FCZ4_IRIPA|nr:zinc finger protein CONSTANS-LIKE 2 isoform X1 [Iris pallida]
MLLMKYSCGNNISSAMQRECDSCRSAPAAVYCRADAAALCAACDADIHAANPISRRHHRVPVAAHCSSYGRRSAERADEDGGRSNNYEALFAEEVDDYLDLVDFNNSSSCCSADQDRQKLQADGREQAAKSEALVPVQSSVLPKKNDGFISYSAQCVSLSSMEASHMVPNATDNTNAYAQPPKGAMELFSSPLLHVPGGQFFPMDREARVLRYREKKKNRKFEKTIRYASRKAYAEARPRIKGRFARRTDVEELEVDQMFSNYAISEDNSGYGIVPTF